MFFAGAGKIGGRSSRQDNGPAESRACVCVFVWSRMVGTFHAPTLATPASHTHAHPLFFLFGIFATFFVVQDFFFKLRLLIINNKGNNNNNKKKKVYRVNHDHTHDVYGIYVCFVSVCVSRRAAGLIPLHKLTPDGWKIILCNFFLLQYYYCCWRVWRVTHTRDTRRLILRYICGQTPPEQSHDRGSHMLGLNIDKFTPF